jgi:hypothetical protein
MRYPVAEALSGAGRHAATIARHKFRGLERGLIPNAGEETATVTFVKINGRTYAVTARHVIQTFDKLACQDGAEFEGYSCVQAPGISILGPFLTPPAEYPSREPDIGICPVADELPGVIGKTAFEIVREGDARWPVSHALAIGFPTVAKHDSRDKFGLTRLALPCVQALAEGIGSFGSSDQVQFHSELTQKPEMLSLSGMSGGPVFWNDGSTYGLIGFVKEALDVTPKEGEQTFYTEPKVNFICQRVDFEIVQKWTRYVDSNWQSERDKINTAIQELQASRRN